MIINSVLRHVEKTGAALLVDGIESEADARWARAMGAVYGQGVHLGPPRSLGEGCERDRETSRDGNALGVLARTHAYVARGGHLRGVETYALVVAPARVLWVR